MSEHTPTPTPWLHYRDKLRPKFSDHVINEVQCRNGPPIVKWAGFDDSERSEKAHAANAAFIVRACNAHDELVAALTEARVLVEKWCHYQGNMPQLFATYLDPIDAALAKALGE